MALHPVWIEFFSLLLQRRKPGGFSVLYRGKRISANREMLLREKEESGGS
jgi:hypothetical protein